MPRLPTVDLSEMPADLQDAVARGRASGMLSTTLPVQVWAHRPALALAWLQTMEQLHAHGLLPARLRELVRLKIASITHCRACQLARKTDVVNEDDVACLSTGDGRFTEPESAALQYAELFAVDHTALNDTHFERLGRSFSVPEIVELNMFCALMLAGGRMTYAQKAYQDPAA